MRLRDVGEAALLVEVDDLAAAQATYSTVLHLRTDTRLALPEVRDVVPAARTVLLDGVVGPGARRAWREALETAETRPADELSGDTVTLRLRYDGDDLDVVAQAWRCTTDDVIERHQAAVFTVAFCGFAPGFAYCTSDPPLPEVPRRDDPRRSVPAGSVALAGEYCGVYPASLPGGWQLLGVTDAVLFDPGREQPALLAPGDRVRFEADS